MSAQIYIPIGSSFIHNGKTVVCVEEKGFTCKGCTFSRNTRQCSAMACTPYRREDGKQVRFVRMKERRLI